MASRRAKLRFGSCKRCSASSASLQQWRFPKDVLHDPVVALRPVPKGVPAFGRPGHALLEPVADDLEEGSEEHSLARRGRAQDVVAAELLEPVVGLFLQPYGAPRLAKSLVASMPLEVIDRKNRDGSMYSSPA